MVDYDELTRVDAEDVYVTNPRRPVTRADSINLAGAGNAALTALTGMNLQIPARLARETSITVPGEQTGSVEVFKLKFTTEPTSVIGYTVKATATSVTDPARRRTALLSADVRMFTARVARAGHRRPRADAA